MPYGEYSGLRAQTCWPDSASSGGAGSNYAAKMGIDHIYVVVVVCGCYGCGRC